VANTITALVPKILAKGQLVLREQAIMPRLVNADYAAETRAFGDTIDVAIASAIARRVVTPAVTQGANQNSAPTKVQIALDQWYESTFNLTDKEMEECDSEASYIPLQVSAAIKSLANGIDDHIMANYTGVWSHSGVPGTTPFASNVNEFRDARKRLNQELADAGDRKVVLDADAEANALNLSIFHEAQKRGDQGGIISGEIGEKFGSQWFLDQNVPTHTAGTWAITGTGYNEVLATVAAGVSTIIIQGNSSTTTNGGSLVVGDVFRISGRSDYQYVVKTAGSVAVGAQATLSVNFSPPLRAIALAAATVEFESASGAGGDGPTDHTVSMLFQRQALGFASRPLARSQKGLGSVFQSVVDPISKVALRLEVNRQYKQTTWAFDVLYGSQLIRPELACRIMG